MGSSTEPTNNEDGANPVADGGCWRTVTTEAAEQQAHAIVVRDNKEKIMRGGKKNTSEYILVVTIGFPDFLMKWMTMERRSGCILEHFKQLKWMQLHLTQPSYNSGESNCDVPRVPSLQN